MWYSFNLKISRSHTFNSYEWWGILTVRWSGMARQEASTDPKILLFKDLKIQRTRSRQRDHIIFGLLKPIYSADIDSNLETTVTLLAEAPNESRSKLKICPPPPPEVINSSSSKSSSRRRLFATRGTISHSTSPPLPPPNKNESPAGWRRLSLWWSVVNFLSPPNVDELLLKVADMLALRCWGRRPGAAGGLMVVVLLAIGEVDNNAEATGVVSQLVQGNQPLVQSTADE